MAITLLDMLLEAELITPGHCDEALQNRVYFGGRIGTTAEALGITRKTLYLKMKKYDLGRTGEIET